MLDLITNAKHWIHFDNYIFRDDATGRLFADALADRARAGVRVRVSTDWLGSFGTGRGFWKRMTAGRITVRHFSPPAVLDPSTLTTRNHRKLVVADGQRAIVGGICIGDEWAGDPARGRRPWRDTAMQIDGPAAAVLDQAFAGTWARTGSGLPPDELASEVAAAGEASVRVLKGEPARERAYRVSELLLAGAGDRVWITDAYLVAPRRLYRYLVDAALEGVNIRLLVPGTSDLALVRNLTRFGYRDLIRAGVRIFEWNGPMLHAKTIVADSRWVRVGSSNMNHSSLVENYELDVLVEDPALATAMEAQFRRDLDQSAEVATRPARGPRRLSRAFPLALDIQEPDRPGAEHRRGLEERGKRSVLALRTLVAGARLAVFGPLAGLLALIGILFFVASAVMAILFGVVFLWLALVAAAAALRRRQDRLQRAP